MINSVSVGYGQRVEGVTSTLGPRFHSIAAMVARFAQSTHFAGNASTLAK
jgi:hypothetical protein